MTTDDWMIPYATGWDSATLPRVAIAAVGFMIAAMVIRSFLRRPSSMLATVIWSLASIALLLFAAIPQEVVAFVISTDYMTRVRVIAAGLSALVLLITLESIRRSHLQERYALLWLATAFAVLFCALLPHAMDLLRALMGMTYGSAIMAIMFTFLILVTFHFSTSLSSTLSKQARIAQRLAILEAKLRELEEGAAKPAHDKPANS